MDTITDRITQLQKRNVALLKQQGYPNVHAGVSTETWWQTLDKERFNNMDELNRLVLLQRRSSC
jgi:hypothetical protein